MCFRSELVWVNAPGINPAIAYLYLPGVPAGKAVTQEKSKCLWWKDYYFLLYCIDF